MRRILVTSALPYANGAIHLGHLFEHVQTDIWVRFQRMMGNECIYVCADDAHGTATMLLAEREGVTSEALIERLRGEHEADFKRFHISHDNYHSTHSPENEHYSSLIYTRLAERGYTFTREVEQLYDPERGLFLADRQVRGTCPRCGAEDQPGDNCDVCGRHVRRGGSGQSALGAVRRRAGTPPFGALFRGLGQVRVVPARVDRE